MKIVNKWSKKIYSVVKKDGNKITLEREDGTRFTIFMSDFMFNYIYRAE